MTFHIGQKVVCILDYFCTLETRECIWPKKGDIYTVRELLDIGTEPSMRVREIKNIPYSYSNLTFPIEPAFVLYAFRPLVEHKTDISVFTEMLTKTRADA